MSSILPKFLIRIFLTWMVFGGPLFGQAQQKLTVTIHYRKGHPSQRLLPSATLGVAYDGHEKGENDLILQPANLKAMQAVGMKPLSYRLRTELANEAWHWNLVGRWSRESDQEGYWTSSEDTGSFISLSYGYQLPRRGNTVDQANNEGYSRIDDGDTTSFWKSNPYLDAYFTQDSAGSHPQWVIIDLGKEEGINVLRILWGNPWALSFTVDYAAPAVYDYFDNAGYFESGTLCCWKPFPVNRFTNSTGSSSWLELSGSPVQARFLRIRMDRSSHTAPAGSQDVRDSLGFAIREIEVGRRDKKGFRDLLTHAPHGKIQDKVYVSSTDPWHRVVDRDTGTEQLGIDRLFAAGLNNRLPLLLSAGNLYDTPDNTLALLEYVHKKRYPLAGLELGEEPDGQMASPRDDAVLYLQWARKIHGRFPSLLLGGPSLQGIIPDEAGELFPTRNWMKDFTAYLEEKKARNHFQFFSFEWYPFDSVCAAAPAQLLQAPRLLGKAVRDMRTIRGLEALPFYMTEYGYSAFSGLSEVTMPGALLNADMVGQFLTLGGSRAFLYGWEPASLQSDFGCAPGNNMLFEMDDRGKIRYRTASYYGAWLVSTVWAQPADSILELYPVTTEGSTKGVSPVTAYALRCPGNSWSLLLLNKDPSQTFRISVQLAEEGKRVPGTPGFPLEGYQYSGRQYQWKTDGLSSHPIRNLPPAPLRVNSGEQLLLPPYSLTVLKSRKTLSKN
ncbi:MAG: discoidin domain-containing protein [Flavisolibacter sp.]